MPIDARTFGHIVLDAELSGVYDVEGHTFEKTFGYLHDYLEQLKTSSDGNDFSQINDFARRMQLLVEKEKTIKAIQTDKRKLNDTVELLSTELLGSVPGEPTLIPGGWHGLPSGHAMIYQFEKSPEGELIFSIYNSGAGLEFHERISTIKAEHYFPVKSFKIPMPLDTQGINNFKYLLQSLLLPQLPINEVNNQKAASAEELYHEIDHCMAFLDAEPIHISKQLKKLDITTAGQISGTCAQRSIHQMLKTNFDSLPHYQRFIFDFKMHALREYIASTEGSRTKKITDDIVLAIENNLKILQQPHVFETESELIKAIQELTQLKQKTIDAFADQIPSAPSPLKTTGWTDAYRFRPTKHIEKDIFINEPHSITERQALTTIEPTHLKANNILKQLSSFIDQLNDLTQDPYKILFEIENCITQLPLPIDSIVFNEKIPFYAEVDEQDNYLELCTVLSMLSEVYADTLTSLTHEGDKTIVTKLSLTALYDYFYTQHAIKHGSISLHPLVNDYLVGEMRSNLKTYHVDTDERYHQLAHLYSEPVGYDSALTYYNKILRTEPDLKRELEKLYDQNIRTKLSSESNDHRALYYLLSNLDTQGNPKIGSSIDSEKFIPLLKKLKNTVDFECFLLQLQRKPNKDQFPTVEKKHYSGSEYYFKFVFPQDAIALKKKESISLSSSNHIQLFTEKKSQEKALLSCKTCFQLNLSVDHFIRNIDKLKELEDQQYLESTLFKPDLLLNALEHDSTFLERIDALIEKGLLHFTDKDGLYTKEALYFIRISLYFNQYLAEYMPEAMQDRFAHSLTRINQQISLCNNPDIITHLHHYRFLTAVAQVQYNDINAGTDCLDDVLISLFHWQLHKDNNAQLNFEFDTAKRKFNDWLKDTHPEILNKSVLTLIHHLIPNILPSDIQLEGTYPLFHFEKEGDTYLIDVEQGLVFKNNLALIKTPSNITTPFLSMALDIDNQTTCFISADQTQLEFISTHTHAKLKLKTEKNVKGAVITKEIIGQKQICINGTEDWYQLVALTDSQQKMNKLPFTFYALPDSLMDGSCQAWTSLDKSKSIITQNNKPIYTIHHLNKDLLSEEDYKIESESRYTDPYKYETLIPLDDQSKETGYRLIKESPYHAKIKCMESDSFFRIHLDKNNTGNICLDRYGFTLEINQEEVRLPGTNFKLVPPEESALSDRIAHLTFTDGKQQQCIVAVQQFYLDKEQPQKSGEYYQYTHDKTNKINKIATAEKEKAITYQVINGELKPSSTSDALYLCFLHLSEHDYDKAWALLENIQRHFTLEGTPEELTYLSWIISQQDPDKVRSNAPRENVCKLKALSIYTNFLAQGKINDEIKQTSFHDNLSYNIYELYAQYLNHKDHLSKKFILEDDTSYSLLNYYEKIHTTQGALGYEWCQLTLKQLLKEQQTLDSLIEVHQEKLPKTFLKRKTIIENQIKTQRNIMKYETKLTLLPIDLVCPHKEIQFQATKISESDWKMLDDIRYDIFCDTRRGNIANPISLLYAGISDVNFFLHFPDYLKIACIRDEKDPDKTALRNFCIRYLIGHRHTALDKQHSNIPYLSQLLYRVMEHPDCMTPYLEKKKN